METNAEALDPDALSNDHFSIDPSGIDRLGIDVACWGERWQVHVTGCLDATGAAAMIDVVEVLTTRRAPAVDLDLSDVTEIDAVGWRAVDHAQDLLRASGAGGALISPPPSLVHPAHRRLNTAA
jgi:anti-anti-sigma regulatory factor